MVVISTVDSSLTPCDCSGWRCQPNALNFKDFISCKKVPPHFENQCVSSRMPRSAICSLLGVADGEEKRAFQQPLIFSVNKIQVCCAPVFTTKQMSTEKFWFKDALSSTLSFLLWILRKEKRIPHISPPVFDIFAAIAASLLVQLKQPQWKISSLIQQTGLSLQYQRAQLT